LIPIVEIKRNVNVAKIKFCFHIKIIVLKVKKKDCFNRVED